MKNKIALLFFVLLALSFLSCGYGTDNFFYSGNYINNRVDHLDIIDFSKQAENLPDKYSVLVVADAHLGSKKHSTDTEKLFNWLDKKKNSPDFPRIYISLGDIADHGYEEEFQNYKSFTDKLKNKYGMYIFDVIGNHDLYNSGWEYYQKYCTPKSTFYKFKTKTFSWYSLDSANGIVGERQFNLLKSDMANDSSPKIVLTHYPLSFIRLVLGMQDTTERNLLLHLFATNNVKLILSGHIHRYKLGEYNGFKEYTLPSFNYSATWALIDVDEKNHTLDFSLHS